jgi:DNA-binding MarR family transcriptional regulator
MWLLYTKYISRIWIRVLSILTDGDHAHKEETVQVSTAPEFEFLTNHAKTLLLIAADRRIRIRDLAGLLRITERATQRIVGDLAKAGYIEREREGRRNVYSVRIDAPLRLPIRRDVDLGSLLAVLLA